MKSEKFSSIAGVGGSLLLHATIFIGLALYGTELVQPTRNAKPLEAFLIQPINPKPVKPNVAPKPAPQRPTPKAAPVKQSTTKAPTPKPEKPTLAQTETAVQTNAEPTPMAPEPSSAPPIKNTDAPGPKQLPITTQPAIDARYAQSNPKPKYPGMARRLGHQGTVTLEITVSSDGSARKVKVAESSGHQSLDEAAVQAISQWRFVPATLNGEPVEQTLLTRWTYKLN